MSFLGKKHTEEWKKETSERQKGKKRSPLLPAKKMSEENKIKLLLANKGRPLSEEHRKKISEANKKPKSEIHKKHLSESHLGKIPSIENRKKRSEIMKKRKCHLWKGGITPINAKIRTSLEYRLWRIAVFERDNYTCIWCGKRGGNLEADHIKSFASYPELRFAIDNGRTLCHECHKTTENFGWKERWKKI